MHTAGAEHGASPRARALLQKVRRMSSVFYIGTALRICGYLGFVGTTDDSLFPTQFALVGLKLGA